MTELRSKHIYFIWIPGHAEIAIHNEVDTIEKDFYVMYTCYVKILKTIFSILIINIHRDFYRGTNGRRIDSRV